MQRYNRAYRDASSPLTPLTPLSTNAFDFNIENIASCSTLALPERARNAALPRVRQQRASNCCAENTRACARAATPKSCDSVLKKRNNYIKVIAALGSGVVTPVPATHRPRTAIKVEPNTPRNVPLIKLQSPPRTKRSGTLKKLSGSTVYSNVKREHYQNSGEYSYTGSGQQLMPTTKHFDASNVRLSSPVAPKPMSPRFGAFLARWGINCLKSIFERQEIDLQTFCCLNADDLELLGIQDPVTRERVIQAIQFVSGFNMNWALE